MYLALCQTSQAAIYQIRTVNIKSGLFFRYPIITWPVAYVGIPNRYPTKSKTPPLSVRNGASYTIITHPFV
jgi:hypothetical protein